MILFIYWLVQKYSLMAIKPCSHASSDYLSNSSSPVTNKYKEIKNDDKGLFEDFL
jgi:hypothetical protein